MLSDNTNRGLNNSSYPVRTEFNNCFIIYFLIFYFFYYLLLISSYFPALGIKLHELAKRYCVLLYVFQYTARNYVKVKRGIIVFNIPRNYVKRGIIVFNSKFGQLPSEYDDFTDSSKPIKTLELFSINNITS